MTLTSRDVLRTAGSWRRSRPGSVDAIETARRPRRRRLDRFLRPRPRPRPTDRPARRVRAPFAEDPIDLVDAEVLEQAGRPWRARVRRGRLRDAPRSTRSEERGRALRRHPCATAGRGGGSHLGGGVESLVADTACEMAPTTPSDAGRDRWAEEFDEERRRRYLERVPLGREGTVEEAVVASARGACVLHDRDRRPDRRWAAPPLARGGAGTESDADRSGGSDRSPRGSLRPGDRRDQYGGDLQPRLGPSSWRAIA